MINENRARIFPVRSFSCYWFSLSIFICPTISIAFYDNSFFASVRFVFFFVDFRSSNWVNVSITATAYFNFDANFKRKIPSKRKSQSGKIYSVSLQTLRRNWRGRRKTAINNLTNSTNLYSTISEAKHFTFIYRAPSIGAFSSLISSSTHTH